MKSFFLLFFVILFLPIHSQVKIDDVGDGWKLRVDSAVALIRNTDSDKYKVLIEVCDHISYWNGGFSTIEDSSTILITQKDMLYGSINNIAAILIHESKHLFFLKNKLKLPPHEEELRCYKYELNFLNKVPNVESWLISNAKDKIRLYSSFD
jgi:hypothetical protein